ncbi:MAG: hypothetical protein ACRCYX_05655 [Dermatophilaceae bacterium]
MQFVSNGADGADGAARVAATRTAAIRRWLPATVWGFALAVLVAGVVSSRRPEWPVLVTFVVFTAALWPSLAAGLQVLWFDRRRYADAVAASAHDVETARVREASANAFFVTMGGLVFLEGFGGVLAVSWMAPVHLAHALILGAGGFALTWGWLRLHQR